MNLTPNLILQIADIRNNPEHWNQKFSLIEFRDKQGKVYWNKHYINIPHWKRYKEAKDWIRNTDFLEYNCKVVWNANNEIVLCTQNYFGTVIAYEQEIDQIVKKIKKKVHQQINQLDLTNPANLLIKKDLESLLTLKTHEEFNNSPYQWVYEELLAELKKVEVKKGKLSDKDLQKQAYDLTRSDLAILWKKQLYFINSVEYSSNYTLYVTITAKKCELSVNYLRWLNSSGWGVCEKGPLIKTESNNFEDHQRMHYDFCGDLGIKKIEQQSFLSYQPNFQLFRATYQTVSGFSGKREITWSDQADTKGGEAKQLAIPSDIRLWRFTKSEAGNLGSSWARDFMLNTLLQLRSAFDSAGAFRKLAQEMLDAKIILTIGPAEMNPSDGCFFSKQYLEQEEILFPKNPIFTRWLKEQPHLWDHTTFQFYLFNKITMSANGRYLGIKPRCDNCNNLIGEERRGKNKCQCSLEQRKIKDFVLPYKLFINYSPCNLYYRWEFAYITVKCEISNEGTFEDWTNPARTMRGFNIKIGGKFLGSGASFGHGANWSDNSEKANEIKQGTDPSPEQEANTERKFKSTYRDFLDKSVEPAMFSANTIDFHYSLGEFFNRLTDPIFFYRVEISEILYNKLTWCNNKAPILNIPLSWKELGSWTQRIGVYKWREVYLEEDTHNKFFTNLMQKGYRLDDGTELENPKLNFAHATSHVQIGGNAWNISIAEENIIEKEVVEEFDEKVAGFNKGDAHASFVTYFRVPDNNLYNQIATKITGHQTYVGKTVRQAGYTPNNNSVDNINAFCWGCVIANVEIPISQGGIVYTFFNQHQGTEQVMEIPDNCTLIINTETGEFRVKGKKIRKEYEVKIGQTRKTVTQEIDQDQLENEVEREELETYEEENKEEILKELGGDKEKETIELENEEEEEGVENEVESEEELEKETETEKEKEKETEQENEGEKEGEQEEENQEQEGENENENEG